jgi:diguanylate cyclase (GGDEF)-like protein
VLRLPENGARDKDILTLFTDPGFQSDLAQYMGNLNLPTLERARVPQKKDEDGGDQFIDVTAERIYNEAKHPLGFLCIVRDVTENVILYQTLESLSITDELTGLFNQRHFFSRADSEIERARRYKKKLSICFFDLDGFKKFNDSQGHVLGDQVLRDTARMMLGTVRTNTDSCFRYGGDEFVILMPETDAQSAMTVAERLRVKLHEFFKGQISASIGIAEYQVTLTAKALVETADKAMYASKAAGGNSIVVAN